MTAAEAATTTIPDTHRDCVLNAFLQGHTIPVLAEHYQLPVTAIVAFLNSPEIQSLREDIAQLAASQTELATTHARTAAILTLHAVIHGQSIDPAQSRAASALLRNTPKTPPRAPHDAVGSPHVGKGSASQPHDAAHARAHANARSDSHAARRRNEPNNESHHEPIAERETVPAHNDPSVSRHARAEHTDAHPARQESQSDAPSPNTQHDHDTPASHARDRPSAAAA